MCGKGITLRVGGRGLKNLENSATPTATPTATITPTPAPTIAPTVTPTKTPSAAWWQQPTGTIAIAAVVVAIIVILTYVSRRR